MQIGTRVCDAQVKEIKKNTMQSFEGKSLDVLNEELQAERGMLFEIKLAKSRGEKPDQVKVHTNNESAHKGFFSRVRDAFNA